VEGFAIYIIGHKLIIDKAQELSKQVLILVGSASESHTLRNPFTSDFRIELLKKVYNNKNIRIEKLNDMTNEYDISYEWGEYVIDNVKKHEGKFADIIVTGNDDLRKGWFSKEQMKNTKEILIDRKKLDISATELRGYLLLRDKENWKKYVPEEIIDDFEQIKNKLLEVKEYKEILEKIKNEKTIENFKNIYKKYEEKDKKEKLKNN
jgi:nicotinamide-nucleotide adenylyltransferase